LSPEDKKAENIKRVKQRIKDKLEKERRLEEERVNKERRWADGLIRHDDVKQPNRVKPVEEVYDNERSNGKVPIQIDSRTHIWVSRDKAVQLPNKSWIRKKDAIKMKNGQYKQKPQQ